MIVLDYYDGPLQGFARDAFGVGPCYFAILAWSEWRDYRLFSVVPVDEEVLTRIETALAEAAGARSPRIGPVAWKFADRRTRRDMEALRRRCIEQSRSPPWLCLTYMADIQALTRIATDDGLRRRVGVAMADGRGISDLREWRDVARPPAQA